ncbi:hypothetical protein G6F57_002174 [Rhizopus arrhizus]|uniref:Uncharacterized protein n=1 Tax=Rhizopus oryzae TaxID=64495 RepID=A0A9P6XGW8_RHIOR|nr:hypothetical protein G6F30_003656 [Rhizopus arrhizus]KAG1427112.1 hypothetical protein G6F58_001184 [Rhizopus delemar]KAG0986949.1 hypothetical protein G6F29_002882 [Rhizopus arrhizus]KAG0999392.1 hypothetical protein G6F28_001046 [Rhizopus arrhizus]KAG1011427.1 hypothetical protein G6F27_003748 [Rhizopus arrhizus]
MHGPQKGWTQNIRRTRSWLRLTDVSEQRVATTDDCPGSLTDAVVYRYTLSNWGDVEKASVAVDDFMQTYE